MLDLYIKKDNDFIKINSIENIDNVDCLIFKINKVMSKQEIMDLECYLSFKTRKTCVVIDSTIEKIYGINS